VSKVILEVHEKDISSCPEKAVYANLGISDHPNELENEFLQYSICTDPKALWIETVGRKAYGVSVGNTKWFKTIH
jgi:hypothetical protein